MKLTWDIFCSVIDNFGDIGVCWRLARQLSGVTRQEIRLWVDDVPRLARLCHAVDPTLSKQHVAGIEVRRWDKEFPAVVPADVVIEGFGVRLPEPYVAAMARRLPRPVWINFEYLSAEKWVDGCHGLPSPHSGLPLVKHFYFPGYSESTGGLLVEEGLTQAREKFQHHGAELAAFWRSIGIDVPTDGVTKISLFCYRNSALAALFDAWIEGVALVVCIVPEGHALMQLSQLAGYSMAAGDVMRRGQLMVHALPFLEQETYDRLLWACDFNFVRGEDSFVRAQLAARPHAWQAYPQEAGAHLTKVSAFLDRYAQALEAPARQSYCDFVTAWNRESPEVAAAWGALDRHRAALCEHARAWARLCEGQASLAAKLADFCQNRLK